MLSFKCITCISKTYQDTGSYSEEEFLDRLNFWTCFDNEVGDEERQCDCQRQSPTDKCSSSYPSQTDFEHMRIKICVI